MTDTAQSGKVYPYRGKEPKQMFEAALDRVVAKHILTFFRSELKTKTQRNSYLTRITANMKPGIVDILKILASGNFPEILTLLSKLPVALHCSRWGVYIRIALPLVLGLPILVYVGSSCCMTIPVGGLAARSYKHRYDLSSGGKV